MKKDNTKPLSKVIRIDESEIRVHLDEMVRGTVEETLNALLDAEADEMYRNRGQTLRYPRENIFKYSRLWSIVHVKQRVHRIFSSERFNFRGSDAHR